MRSAVGRRPPPGRAGEERGDARGALIRAGVVAAVAAVLLPANVHGQEDTLKAIRVQGVRVVAARPSATAGGASTVTISLDSAGVAAAPTAEELLRRMPVIQLRANSRGEVQPNLRGAEDRQIAVLLDGIPLTLGWDHRTDLSIVPLTAVRRVTLLRELSSILHGPNVLGGAVEFDVVGGARRQSAAPPIAGALSIDQEGGIGAGATAEMRLDRTRSSWTLRTGAGFRARQGVTLPGAALADQRLRPVLLANDDGLRLNSDRKQADGFVAARYEADGGAWLSSLATVFETDRGVPPEAHVAEPRLWRYPSQNRVFVTASGGTGERRTPLGATQLETNFGFDRSETHIDEYATPAYESVTGGETGATTTLTGRLVGEHAFNSEWVEIGFATTFASVSHREAPQDGPPLDYLQRLWSVGTELRVGNRQDGSGTLWTAGVALDGANTPKSGDKPKLGNLADWAFRTGITRASGGGRVLYHASVSRRDRFPSLRELYSGALGRFEPNPSLRPEALVAAEAGVTVGLDVGQFQLTTFHHRLGGGIVRTTLPGPTGTKFIRVNRHEVRSSGVELVVGGGSGPFSYGGDLTLQRVRIVDPSVPDGDDRAEYEPALSGMATLSAPGPWGLALSGTVRFRGSQYCRSVDAPGMEPVPPSTTLDFEARRTFLTKGGRSLGGAVAIANAGDSMVLDQCGLPQPGRTVRIQFNLR